LVCPSNIEDNAKVSDRYKCASILTGDDDDDDDGNDDGSGRRQQRRVLNARRRRRRGGSENPVRWASWAAIPSFALSFASRGGDSRGAVGASPLTIVRGGQKKSRALTQPFKTPRKSGDNDDEENGFSFQNMMSMMMYQN
jgi:hypothetical protein